MRIELHDSAEKDLLNGFDFYERQSKGLGGYFLESLLSDIDSLYFNAVIHAIHFGYHRLLSKKFPFAIYYKSDKEIIRIYAILDCRRNPAWTRDRLS